MARAISKRPGRAIPEAMADSMPVTTELKAPPSHEQIALKAYERWEKTGSQTGSTELDWAEAERGLTT